MNTHRLVTACLLAALSLPAWAVTPGALGDLAGQTLSIGNSAAPGQVFSESYTFDLAFDSIFAGTAVTLHLDLPPTPGVEFSLAHFSLALFDANHTLLAQDVASAPDDFTLSLPTALAAASGYRLVVSGTATGTLGGGYGGVLAAAPVPEPHTWAMLLAGLGLTGWVTQHARRRSAG
jgi:hypothetical protein